MKANRVSLILGGSGMFLAAALISVYMARQGVRMAGMDCSEVERAMPTATAAERTSLRGQLRDCIRAGTVSYRNVAHFF